MPAGKADLFAVQVAREVAKLVVARLAQGGTVLAEVALLAKYAVRVRQGGMVVTLHLLGPLGFHFQPALCRNSGN